MTRAETAAERLGDQARLSKALDTKAYALASSGRVDEAIEAGRRCVRICEGLDDDQAYVGANMELGRALYAAGRYREAVLQGRKVRDFLGDDIERGYTASAQNQVVCSRAWLTLMQSETGEFDAAEHDIENAFRFIQMLRWNEHERVWCSVAFGRLRQCAATMTPSSTAWTRSSTFADPDTLSTCRVSQ